MPLFDYLCADCLKTTEILVKASEALNTVTCKACGGIATKQMGRPYYRFKGQGWTSYKDLAIPDDPAKFEHTKKSKENSEDGDD